VRSVTPEFRVSGYVPGYGFPASIGGEDETLVQCQEQRDGRVSHTIASSA